MRILHLEKNCYPIDSLRQLESRGNVVYCDFVTLEEYRQHLATASYDAIFTKLGMPIERQEMELQKDLRYIVTPTTGLNHIDLAEAERRAIKIISLKNEGEFLSRIQSTAEHTWMLLLSLIRNLGPAQASVKNGVWSRAPFLADELNTQTLGIVGFGRLGKILAGYAEAFSMNVMCCDSNSQVFEGSNAHYKHTFEEVLTSSDYLILQVDYKAENEKMFDQPVFEKMKPGSYFINTSRGEIVDEPALLKALETGHLKGAAVDVLTGDSGWGSESEENLLIEYSKKNDNLIITPHMGGYGKRSIELTREFVVNKFLKSL